MFMPESFDLQAKVHVLVDVFLDMLLFFVLACGSKRESWRLHRPAPTGLLFMGVCRHPIHKLDKGNWCWYVAVSLDNPV